MAEQRLESVTGKDGVAKKDGSIDAPDNVIPNEAAARVVYDRLKDGHGRRCWTYERIQGMLDGNPPYNPKSLARSGLSDMTNVNWKDGEAVYRSIALAYWSLFNDVESIAEFRINLADDKGLNAEWGKILSEEWDKVIRSWPNFSKHMSFHQGELLKFGLNALIWPDERDWRFKPVNAKKFILPDQTLNDSDELSTVIIENTYTAQYLWGVYENIESKKERWDKESLGEILFQLSTISDDFEGNNSAGCAEIQKRIKNGDTFYNELYNDDITLVSIFQKEYDEKITHIMVHRSISTTDFLYLFDRQYKDFREALMYFSFQPGEETIHGNKGIGHSVFSAIEAITQLDCSVLDQAKRAGSLLLKAGASRGRDERQIRFVHGGVIDIGESDIAQNTMGNNVAQTVEVSRYFRQKIFTNNSVAGMDPGNADRNVQSARQVQQQATKEAKVQKNMIAHYYEQLDYLFREVVRKMLLSKSSHPGNEYVKVWKDRCISRGVPSELFDISKAQKSPDGLPVYMELFATRSAGSGSQIADQIEMQQVMQILPTLGERGRKNVLKDYISSFRGHRYVNRYFPPEDQDSQPTGDDTLASIENNQFDDGKQVVVSPDNNHVVHMTNHMRMMKQIIETFQQDQKAMFDENTTMLQKVDTVMQAVGPHFVKHLFFGSQDPTRQAEIQQLNAEWAVVANFGDMIANNANKQREGDLAKVQAQQEALAQQEAQGTPEHIKARGQVELAARKLEADIAQGKMREQFRFALEAEKLKNNTQLQAFKTTRELAITATKELGESDEQNTEFPR